MIDQKKTIQENNIQDHNDQENNNKNIDNDNLIQLLNNQLRESDENIIKIKIQNEQEIISFHERIRKETEKSIKFSLETLLKDFLPIIDNVERALDLIKNSKSKENFKKITHELNHINNVLQQCFKIFSIKKIDDTNILFNPSVHQAMSVHYTNEIEPNKIITVMQPGYILHNTRLLRPAMVIVSKKKI